MSPEPVQDASDLQRKIDQIRGQLNTILVAAGGQESNVQYPSTYWFLHNQLKSLTRQL